MDKRNIENYLATLPATYSLDSGVRFDDGTAGQISPVTVYSTGEKCGMSIEYGCTAKCAVSLGSEFVPGSEGTAYTMVLDSGTYEFDEAYVEGEIMDSKNFYLRTRGVFKITSNSALNFGISGIIVNGGYTLSQDNYYRVDATFHDTVTLR